MEVLLVDLPECLERKRRVTIHEDGAVELAEAFKHERRILEERTSRMRVGQDS